jgi:hypothetical protein
MNLVFKSLRVCARPCRRLVVVVRGLPMLSTFHMFFQLTQRPQSNASRVLEEDLMSSQVGAGEV